MHLTDSERPASTRTGCFKPTFLETKMENTVPTETTRNPISLDELKLTPEFAALNPAQQMFVEQIAAGLSLHDAAAKAYETVKPENRKALIFRLNETPTVKAAIDRLYGVTEYDRYVMDLARTATRTKGLAKVLALRTLGQAKGFIPNERSEVSVVTAESAAPEVSAVAEN